MSYKSRGNYKMGLCLKSDCSNRDLKCESCVRFSEYTQPMLKQVDGTKAVTKKLRVSLYGMPLEKYNERRRGNKMPGKGSWPRGVNPNGEDWGELGCRSGLGIHHPMTEKGVCKYCGKTKEEIEKLQGR